MRKRWTITTALMLVLALLLGACSGQDAGDEVTDDGGSFAPTTTFAASDSDTTGEGGGGDDAAEEPADGLTDGGEPTVQADSPPIDLGRDIIYTADVVVAVSDVVDATMEARRVIQELGGFVFGEQTTGAPESRTILTFKVRPDDFSAALDGLSGIGDLRSQNVSATDVTERVVDLRSRIETAEASVERLRAFLAEADSVETISELEQALLERETELESLRGQVRTLEDAVALATITLTITEAGIEPRLGLGLSAYPGHDGLGSACPAGGGTQIEEGGDVTLCFEIVNNGDADLTDFEVRDTVLDLDLGDLIVVFGDPEGVLAPGQSIILAYETTAERDLRTQTTVTAVPVDAEGERLEARSQTATQSVVVDTFDPGGVPTFADGVSASWDFLVTLLQLGVLVIGLAIPFLWVPLLLWLFIWWMRRRSGAKYDVQSTTYDEEDTEPVEP